MSFRAASRRAVPLAALALALAGCGGSGSGSSSSTGSSSAASSAASATASATATATATSTIPAGTDNGVASKSGKEIIAASEAALGQVHSFRIDGTTVDGGRPSTITGEVQIPGRLSVTLLSGPTSAHIVTIDDKIYFNANTAYFVAQKASAAVIQQLSNRWVSFPTGAGPSLGSLSAAVNSTTVGQCLIAAHLGTLTVKGAGSVNGQPAVIVADAGDVAGSSPGRIYVATTGEPLPLRTVQTGSVKPGGTPNKTCDETAVDVSGSTSASTATFSQYNSAPAISTPPNAVDITSLSG